MKPSAVKNIMYNFIQSLPKSTQNRIHILYIIKVTPIFKYAMLQKQANEHNHLYLIVLDNGWMDGWIGIKQKQQHN